MIEGKKRKTFRKTVRISIEYWKLYDLMYNEGDVPDFRQFVQDSILSRAMSSKKTEVKQLSLEIRNIESQIGDREISRMVLANTMSGYTFKRRIQGKILKVIGHNSKDSDQELDVKVYEILRLLKREAESYNNSDELVKYVEEIDFWVGNVPYKDIVRQLQHDSEVIDRIEEQLKWIKYNKNITLKTK